MGLYEEIKEVAKIVKQSSNIDLFSKLTELSSQALDMQSEIVRLTNEIKELRSEKDIELQIIRYKELFVTLKNEPEIRYCSHCLDSDKKLIQVHSNDSGGFRCPHCSTSGIYDKVLNDKAIAARKATSQNRRTNHW